MFRIHNYFSLLVFLASIGCNDNSANVEPASSTISPRSAIRSAISNLDSKFEVALLSSWKTRSISSGSRVMPTPAYSSGSSYTRANITWDTGYREYQRLTLEIVDHDFNSAEDLGSIVFEVKYYQVDASSTGGFKRQYTVSFLHENGSFELEKVMVARGKHKEDFGSPVLFNHQDDPTIEALLGDFIQF